MYTSRVVAKLAASPQASCGSGTFTTSPTVFMLDGNGNWDIAKSEINAVAAACEGWGGGISRKIIFTHQPTAGVHHPLLSFFLFLLQFVYYSKFFEMSAGTCVFRSRHQKRV